MPFVSVWHHLNWPPEMISQIAFPTFAGIQVSWSPAVYSCSHIWIQPQDENTSTLSHTALNALSFYWTQNKFNVLRNPVCTAGCWKQHITAITFCFFSEVIGILINYKQSEFQDRNRNILIYQFYLKLINSGYV